MEAIDPTAWRRGWFSLLAPYTKKSDDDRGFEALALVSRKLPLPLSLQIQLQPQHMGSVMVGAITSFTQTEVGVFAAGSWLDPTAVPEVNRAIALAAVGLARPSVDLVKGKIVAQPMVDEDGPFMQYQSALCSGATIVAAPSFDSTYVKLVPDGGTKDEMAESLRAALVASGFTGEVTFSEGSDDTPDSMFALTGATSWKTIPIASRDYEFNADDAVRRIMQWANGNDAKIKSMHLILRPEYNVGTRDRYKFPIGDIIDGKPHLVFHAVYSAAAILNGAHGGVKNVTDAERSRLQSIITEMYQRMSKTFNDPNLVAPWVRRAKLPENKASVTASAGIAPVKPPAEWFRTPEPDRPTRMTVTPDGRVFGHLAPKDMCHLGWSKATGECVTPPPSKMGYKAFHTGTVVASNGETIEVGRITTGTTHPVGATGASLSAAAAAHHYDNTGACAAVVRATDGKHGIWLSGVLTPEADEATAAMVRRHPPSGDWRDIDGNLELVAALAVNSAGFPVFSLEDGVRKSLVASAAPGCLQEAGDDIIADMGSETVDAGTGGNSTDAQQELGATESPVRIIDPDEFRKLLDEELGRRDERKALSDQLDAIILGDWSSLSDQLDQLAPGDGE